MKNAMSKNRLAKYWFENSSRFRFECLQILQQKNLFVSNVFWVVCGDDIKIEILSLKEIKPWQSEGGYLTMKAKNILETITKEVETESVKFSNYGEYGKTEKNETIHVMFFGELMVNRCYLKSLFRVAGVRLNQCKFESSKDALHVFYGGKKIGMLMGIKLDKTAIVKVGGK
tara:strand:+ start:463 stop:978 length:516 start_codon:yes stop_codon:yes gene_type:complete